jgi:hypothetical protein
MFLLSNNNFLNCNMKILTPIVILCASIAFNTLAALMIVGIIDHFIDPYIILGIGLLLFISTLFIIKR